MSKNDDDILAQEIGKAGELGGKLGGLFSSGSAVGNIAGLGGSFGATFAAKFLPTEIIMEKLPLKIPPERALKFGFSVLTKLGALQSDDENKPPYPLLKAVVKSGFLNMNPAVVYFEILDGDPTACEVTITAAAKEGLIKQHTAENAVRRVVTMLKEMV